MSPEHTSPEGRRAVVDISAGRVQEVLQLKGQEDGCAAAASLRFCCEHTLGMEGNLLQHTEQLDRASGAVRPQAQIR